MKRNNDSDLQSANKPSNTKRANVATNHSNQAIVSTTEAPVITPNVAPSYHRTLMQLCRENLQLDGSETTADVPPPFRQHDVCIEPFQLLSIPTSQSRSTYLLTQSSNTGPEAQLQLAGQFQIDMTRMPLIQQQQEDQQRAASLSIAAIVMNSNTHHMIYFDQIAPEIDHLFGRYSAPFPMTSLNAIFDTNQNRVMNRIAKTHVPLECSTFSGSCATSPGTTTAWQSMPSLSSSIRTLEEDSSRARTANILVTAMQVTNRVPAESRGVQPMRTTSFLSILPSCITTPIDFYKLSPHQCLLREQIEYFEATDVDAMVPIRGRNKQITTGQVGIRCKNCAHVPMSRRQKGSTYFPSNKLGIYQAAQNMSTTHLQCGLCKYTPASIKNKFATIMMDRQRNDNGAGRPYWAKSATQFGFIDTEEHGIRFIRSALPLGACVTEKDLISLES